MTTTDLTAPVDDDVLPGRDRYVDFMRAFSLLVVVVWHAVFTILVWGDDGPRATSPLGFFRGVWVLTWLFQVMPLFFFIGGYAHLAAWSRARDRGDSLGAFVWRRARALAIPAIALVAVWTALAIAIVATFDVAWMGRALFLVVSPLWFLAVYLLLIALLPLTLRLHARFDVLTLVWLAGLAGLVDIVRFRNDLEWVGWFNMFLVWAFCHQLGFVYARLVRAPRRVAWSLLWAGLFGLIGMTYTGIYPGSMVGVPGERFSNMAPPTLPMIALAVFQAGVAMLIRPWVLERLETSRRWSSTSEVINRFAMPLYLFHSTGIATSRGVWHWIRGGQEQRDPDLVWWATRPFALAGALLFTLPVILVFGKRWVRPGARSAP